MRGKRAAHTWIILSCLVFCLFSYSGPAASSESIRQQGFSQHIQAFSDISDRSSGTEGAARAAAYIKAFFKDLGYETGAQTFSMPVRRAAKTRLTIEKTGQIG